jgi:hypothetical protein
MTKIPANIAIIVLLGLTLACITILAALGQPIPEVLSTVALVAAGGGAGLSLPAALSAPQQQRDVLVPAVEPAPAPQTVGLIS